jgi:hypothetical protein
MNIAIRFAVLLLVHAILCPPMTYAGSPGLSKNALKIRTQILKLGIGEEASLEVRLKDKTKLKGYISEAGDDHFVLVEAGTNRQVTIPYHQVQQGKGHNLNTGVKVLIVIGILFLVGALVGMAISD